MYLQSDQNKKLKQILTQQSQKQTQFCYESLQYLQQNQSNLNQNNNNNYNLLFLYFFLQVVGGPTL